jgi:hypothetical protein
MNDERGVSKEHNLRLRTRSFALRIVRLYTSLPKSAEAQILGKQLLRSGTSVGAHYHEATRSRSNAEFVYWLNLLIDSGVIKKAQVSGLCDEADELTAILVASVKTVKNRR